MFGIQNWYINLIDDFHVEEHHDKFEFLADACKLIDLLSMTTDTNFKLKIGKIIKF
jgi:hypothetical protein